MSPVKRQIMEEALASRTRNTSETAAVIMAAMKKMKMAGEAFTPKETEILMEELMNGMSPAERAKAMMIKNMINKKA